MYFLRYLSACSLSGASTLDSVLSSPQILNVPLLLLANKLDSPMSLSVEEIRHDYEDWHQRKLESARRDVRYGEGDNETSTRRERIASLDVMGISALEG
jgi:ADP-ribosylation factor related protein 1